jgi:hypothetical protein
VLGLGGNDESTGLYAYEGDERRVLDVFKISKHTPVDDSSFGKYPKEGKWPAERGVNDAPG